MIRYPSAVRWAAIGCALSIAPLFASAQNYTQTNLVSDISGMAASLDPNLKNPWGLARGASSPWWPNNEGTGTATLYTGSGTIVPLVVTIPNPAGSSPSQPTGMVFNGTADFVINAEATPSPALFIFATKEGSIAAWNEGLANIEAAVTEVSENGSVFTGLTWVELNGAHFLLAANFAGRSVEAFDTNFKRVPLAPWQFVNDAIPQDYAPYNVQAVGDNVVVTWAKQNASKTAADDSSCGGPNGCGFVDIFTKGGVWIAHLLNGPQLQAPWGVALAPQDFGFFSHDLLIGNRASGTIAAFSWRDGQFLGFLEDANNNPIVLSGLWAIEFDNRGNNQFGVGSTTLTSTGPALFFAAGINNYADGLFGALTPTAAQLNAEDHE
jgi:uncharacterized protein (TIGR03118 family)